jgi:hypothetical protein
MIKSAESSAKRADCQASIIAVVNGKNYMILHRFCRGLSVCDRHQGFRRDNEEWIVYCFKERSDAEYFHMHFPNGEFVKPEERPRWPGKR